MAKTIAEHQAKWDDISSFALIICDSLSQPKTEGLNSTQYFHYPLSLYDWERSALHTATEPSIQAAVKTKVS